MTDVRYLVDIANVSAGEVVSQTAGTAEWLSQRGLVEILAPEPAPQIEEPALETPVVVEAVPETSVAEEPTPEPEVAIEVVSEAPVAEEPPKRRPGRPRKTQES